MTTPKVFLSYSSADEGFVTVLHRRLKKDGIDCFFAPDSIAPGENWVMGLQEAIEECNYLILVLTEAYLSSDFAQAEWASITANDPLNTDRRLIPLLLKQCELPPFLRQLKYLDVSSDIDFERNYPRLRGILQQWASHDIERRNEEIEELFEQGDVDRAMKRLLDFMRDFAAGTDVSRIVAIRVSLREVAASTASSLLERAKARAALLEDALNLKDLVIDRLAAAVA